MIKPLLFTYLGMVIAVIIMDFKHVRQAAAINRWLSYGLIAISAGIWFYVTNFEQNRLSLGMAYPIDTTLATVTVRLLTNFEA